MSRFDLERLSKDELIELVLRLQRPTKTSRTSSKPPSTDRKERREKAKPGGAKPGHKGHSRRLSEDVDRIVDHHPDECPCCRMPLSSDLPAEVVSEHDKVELPVIKPFVERHRRLTVRCPSCGAMVVAPAPAAAKGTPFGPRLHAVATYFKTFQALSYERLQGAFDHLFGLTISQGGACKRLRSAKLSGVAGGGGLMNMLRRAQGTFVAKRDHAVAILRQAKVVASDKTGVRIEGSNAFHWVFRCNEAVVHQASPIRGAVVIRDMMDGHRPAVWLSDRYSAQQGHAGAQQTCLAHLARDVAYADQAGEDFLPMRLKLWLQGAFTLAARIEMLAPATITARRRALERRLTAILETPTSCDLARDLQNRFRRARDQLLTFAKWPGLVDPSNNGCERALRPSVVQRKVTNGYRAMWAAAGEADIRTVVDTARIRPGTNAFEISLQTVSA
ncbi:IS66 family transposase [Lichenifustis flavocetrariae]|uniref:Transposase n=1 Tax=Lichenifustis flavocetrariae TaxID=2949735 RepID=A0AA41Z429_9HYPH|nr:transposase [Lichenifustis flavocetrariae]MCW6512641.1 transposase [Lichenifustis flavocetrariae]